jgi:hypothetical protein
MLILKNEVIAGNGERSASNAGRAPHRAAAVPCRQVMAGMRSQAERLPLPVTATWKSGPKVPVDLRRESAENPRSGTEPKNLQQGIAKRRRHVAPALLLC